jgi:hypothetical protein
MPSSDADRQRDVSLRRRVLGGIDQEVGQDLGDARRIAPHGDFRVGQYHAQVLLLAFNERSDLFHRRMHASPEVHLAHVEHGVAAGDARDVQQIVDQMREMAHLAIDDAAGFAHASRIVAGELQHLGRGADRRERIAQFVRERGEEAILPEVGVPQRTLAAFQRLLHQFSLVDFGAGAHPAHDGAVRIADGLRAPERPAVFAAAVTQAVFDFVGLARLQAVAPSRPCARLVVGVEHPVPAFAVGGPFRDAGERIPLAVVVIVEAVGQSRPHHLRDHVRDGAEPLFALAQRGDQCFAIGDVRPLHENRLDLSGVIDDGLVDEVDIALFQGLRACVPATRQLDLHAAADEAAAGRAHLVEEFQVALFLQFGQDIDELAPGDLRVADQHFIGRVRDFETRSPVRAALP